MNNEYHSSYHCEIGVDSHDNILWLLHILGNHALNARHFAFFDIVWVAEDTWDVENAKMGTCGSRDLNFEHLYSKILFPATRARIYTHVRCCNLSTLTRLVRNGMHGVAKGPIDRGHGPLP